MPARRRRSRASASSEASSLAAGDLVTHIEHGVGRYIGLKTLDVAGAPHDHPEHRLQFRRRGGNCFLHGHHRRPLREIIVEGRPQRRALVLREPGPEPDGTGGEAAQQVADEIKAFVRDRLSAYAYPRRIEFVADRPGLDQIAQGMGGLMSITGLPGQGPVRVGIPVADLTADLLGRAPLDHPDQAPRLGLADGAALGDFDGVAFLSVVLFIVGVEHGAAPCEGACPAPRRRADPPDRP